MSQNYVISVFGRKGSGKSTLVKEIVKDSRRVIVLDTVGDYDDAIEDPEQAILAIGMAQHKKRFRVIVRLEDDDDALAALRVAYDVTDYLLVIEETSFYTTPHFLPPEIKKLVRYGRHRSISQVYVSRRPAEINRELTAQSDLIVSFAQHEPADIKYLRAVMGPQAEKLPHLPKYHVLISGDLSEAPLPVLERVWIPPEKRLDDDLEPV